MKNKSIEELLQKGVLKPASELKSTYARKSINLKKIFPEGEFIEIKSKELFVVKKEIPVEERTGNIALQKLYSFNQKSFPEIKLDRLNLEELIFVDFETTGSASFKNFIFLAGTGFFQNEKFVIIQYFCEDYYSELALIEQLIRIFKKYKYIVTFNGKSFDWVVFKHRLIINHREEEIPNENEIIDILRIYRRFYGSSLFSYNLQYIETKFLNYIRNEPEIEKAGGIPEIYLRFIRRINYEDLKKVFIHNFNDVIVLPALLSVILEKIEKIRRNEYEFEFDLYSIAEIYRDEPDKYISILEENFYKEGDLNTFKKLIKLYKKEKRYEKLKELLTKGITDPVISKDYTVYKELMIYYNKVEKNREEINNIINKAKRNIKYFKEKEIDDLIKREEKVKRRRK